MTSLGKFTLAFSALVAVAGCTHARRSASIAPSEEREYATILIAALDFAFPDTAALLALHEYTENLQRAPRSAWVKYSPDSLMLDDFLLRNRKPVLVSRYLLPSRKTFVLDSGVMARIDSETKKNHESWEVAMHRFLPTARGLTTLTQPGLSADKGTAFVYVFYWCGGLCGWGDAFVLRRADDNSWRVIARHRLVVL